MKIPIQAHVLVTATYSFSSCDKKIILLLPSISECCCWPTYQAFLPLLLKAPRGLAHQLLFSALNELSPSFCEGILHQISTHISDMSLHWLQHLLHCQVRTFKDFLDYKVLSVNICSEGKKSCWNATLYTRVLTFCTQALISFFSHYSIFSFIISQPLLVGEMLQPSDHLQSQHYNAITL